MTKRVILAGILGGIALFLWGSLAHIALPLGEIGVGGLPNEQVLLPAMQASIPNSGFYIFPGGGLSVDATHAQRAAAMQELEKKAATGPNGILVYHPSGGGLTAGRLINEFVLNVVETFLLAIVLAWGGLGQSYGGRVTFVGFVGLFGSLGTNIQYWNWYGFPTNYTVAYIFTQVIGFIVVGLVVAAFIRGARARTDAAG